MYLQTKKRRTGRRTNKYRYNIIQTLLSSILIKNPDKFVIQAVQGARDDADFKNVIKKLTENDELYVQQRHVEGDESHDKC